MKEDCKLIKNGRKNTKTEKENGSRKEEWTMTIKNTELGAMIDALNRIISLAIKDGNNEIQLEAFKLKQELTFGNVNVEYDAPY